MYLHFSLSLCNSKLFCSVKHLHTKNQICWFRSQTLTRMVPWVQGLPKVITFLYMHVLTWGFHHCLSLTQTFNMIYDLPILCSVKHLHTKNQIFWFRSQTLTRMVPWVQGLPKVITFLYMHVLTWGFHHCLSLTQTFNMIYDLPILCSVKHLHTQNQIFWFRSQTLTRKFPEYRIFQRS